VCTELASCANRWQALVQPWELFALGIMPPAN
jgi:hypothetical protein